MGVEDCRHSVDLEVLVGADLEDTLDGSPVGERRLGIVEPIVAEMLNVMVVDDGQRAWRSRFAARGGRKESEFRCR